MPYHEWEGDDPTQIITSLNLHRRHLDEAQRGMIAARLTNLRNGQRTPSQICEAAISQPYAAKMLNVSSRTVHTAKTVLSSESPELIAAVDSGMIAVSAAAELAHFDALMMQADFFDARTIAKFYVDLRMHGDELTPPRALPAST